MKAPIKRCLLIVLVLVLIGGIDAADLYFRFGPTPPRMTAEHNPMQYYLSLPQGWNPQQKWPLLVTIDGSNKEFARNARIFQRARGSRPYIVVTPLVVSNGPRYQPQAYNYSAAVWQGILNSPNGYVDFDEQGILAVVAEVRQKYGGESKFYMNGWSAGGRISWVMILKHPEMLAGAVLAAANYGNGTTTFSTAPARVDLPIKAFQGTWDSGLDVMNAQWMQAMAVARAHDYKNISRDMVPWALHDPFADQTFAFIDGLETITFRRLRGDSAPTRRW